MGPIKINQLQADKHWLAIGDWIQAHSDSWYTNQINLKMSLIMEMINSIKVINEYLDLLQDVSFVSGIFLDYSCWSDEDLNIQEKRRRREKEFYTTS